MAEMMPQSALVPDSDYVIIGGTGDLALRKIFPALFWRFLDGQVTSAFRLVAAARQPISLAEFAEKLRPFCRDALDHPDTDAAAFDAFIQLVHIVQLDILTGEGAADLSAFLQQKTSTDRPCIFYLAVAPQLFGPSCRVLQSAGLVLPQSRLVVEKPLGHDYASAQAIGDELRAVFDEKQIYRIDHYLGKETVQNLMALRVCWLRRRIRSVTSVRRSWHSGIRQYPLQVSDQYQPWIQHRDRLWHQPSDQSRNPGHGQTDHQLAQMCLLYIRQAAVRQHAPKWDQ